MARSAPKPRPITRAVALAAVAIAAGTGSRAAAQEPGGVHLRGFDGEFRLEGELRDEQSRSFGGNAIDEVEWLLRENLRLHFLGDVFDRRLLDIDTTVDFGLEQREVDSRGRPARSSDETRFFYNASALLLRERPVNVDVYAWRSQIETRQRFFATSRADLSETGANLRINRFPIPSQLHYDQFRYVGEGIDTTRERRERFRVSGARNTDQTSIDYAYEFNRIDLMSFGTAYDETVARVAGTQRLGRNTGHYARVSAYFRDQLGDVATETAQGSGLLHLQWLDELFTEHGVIVDQSEVGRGPVSSQDRIEVNSAIQHRLYESLDTRVHGRTVETDLGVAEIQRVQTGGDLTYRKNTFFGVAALSYRPDVYVQDETGSDESIPVLDEPHTFTPGVPIVLDNLGVDPFSIFVTDSTGATIFFEPADYVATSSGGRVRLDIPVGSRILPDATILVDYEFLPRPSREFRSIRHETRARFEVLDFASLELGYGTQRQTLLSGIDIGGLDNSREKSARVRLFQWDQEVGADYEDRDSSFTPYERVQFHAISRLEPAADVRLLSQARVHRTRIKRQLSRERGITLDSTLEWRVGQPSSLYLRGEYRKVDLQVDKGDGWMAELGFNYRVRSTEFAFSTRYVEENFERASDQRLVFATFTFRRYF